MEPKSHAASGTCRDSCPCTLCARMLITDWLKRTRRSASSASKSGFTEARFLIRKRQWRAARALTRSTSHVVVMDASVVHVHAASARADATVSVANVGAVAHAEIEDKRGRVSVDRGR